VRRSFQTVVRAIAVGLAVSLLAAGCGSAGKVSTVEGAITVDGAPVPTGTISFSPLESGGAPAVSADIHEGKYRSEEVPRGKLLVHINAFVDTGEKFYEFGIAYPKMKNLVPDTYQGGIEFVADAPEMKHDFELTAK
jgi:hypothetical protein